MLTIRCIALWAGLLSLVSATTQAVEPVRSTEKIRVAVAQLLPLDETDIVEMTNPHKTPMSSKDDCGQCHGGFALKPGQHWQEKPKGLTL